MSDCIFCKLANHEIPTTVVYENDLACAFEDAEPQAPVHVLVVPKQHYVNMADEIPAETLSAMAECVREVARAKNLGDGFRLISNAGAAAGQTVMHLHWHILGGKPLGEGLLPE